MKTTATKTARKFKDTGRLVASSKRRKPSRKATADDVKTLAESLNDLADDVPLLFSQWQDFDAAPSGQWHQAPVVGLMFDLLDNIHVPLASVPDMTRHMAQQLTTLAAGCAKLAKAIQQQYPAF